MCFFSLGGERHVIPEGGVVSGILDMRKRKRVLHFVVEDELLPHAIVNIPNNEKMHLGVSHFTFFFVSFYFMFFI
jgi:hypothetical protein